MGALPSGLAPATRRHYGQLIVKLRQSRSAPNSGSEGSPLNEALPELRGVGRRVGNGANRILHPPIRQRFEQWPLPDSNRHTLASEGF